MLRADLTQFDYRKVAALDAEMWRSYYNHRFFRLFFQLVRLVRLQIGLNWLFTLRLAFYAGWAAAYYRINKKKGVDSARVVKNLTKFYQLISQNSLQPFDYRKAAELELAWWDVHRPSYKNSPALERSLAEGAAAIYSVKPSALKEYAHYRAVAMILPRHEGDDQKTPTDWQEVHRLLEKAWRSLHKTVQK